MMQFIATPIIDVVWKSDWRKNLEAGYAIPYPTYTNSHALPPRKLLCIPKPRTKNKATCLRQLRVLRFSQGLCTQCGGEREPAQRICADCIARRTEDYFLANPGARERRAAKLLPKRPCVVSNCTRKLNTCNATGYCVVHYRSYRRNLLLPPRKACTECNRMMNRQNKLERCIYCRRPGRLKEAA
jgi:uncharacterized OB-fold protein